MQVVNTWRPELDGGSMSTHYVLFVLTVDGAGLYAAYWGLAAKADDPMKAAYRIAGSGSKLSFEKSKFAFSGIEEKEYRA